ncbi:MAG TPA: hypothetical protein VD969_01255 [Symbiobacteriaceae bacterium]|nr:hypothetical protein [Symbiobacteriaceae bacterium]
MVRRAVVDWLTVTVIGLVIGLVMAGAVAGWVWWHEGVITLSAVGSQLLYLSAVVLLIACTVARPILSTLKDSLFLTNIQLPRGESASRPYRKSFGILLLAGGLWGLMIVLLLDALFL